MTRTTTAPPPRPRPGAQEQAQQALADLGGKVFDFRYIFMDIENNGVPPDGDGWNTVWNGPCGNTVRAGYIPANVDFATWAGFAGYIDQSLAVPGRRLFRGRHLVRVMGTASSATRS